jgi:cyclohexanecarboxylate-CoA ligase
MSGIADAPRVSDADKRRYRAEGSWRADTVNEWIDRRAAEMPDRLAAVGPDGEITYRALRDRTLRLANGLKGLGIGRGDVVGLQLPNSIAFLLAFYGLARLGAVASTLHTPYRGGEIEPLLRHGCARAVICGPAAANYDAPATMLGLTRSVETLESVIVATDAAPEGTHSLFALAEGPDDTIADPPGPEDPLVLAFTSGTSAAPKAVLRDHESALANNHQAVPVLGMVAGDAVLAAAPYTHIFGLGALTATLVAGATAVLMPAFTPDALIESIERHRATMMFGAPAHVASILKEGLHRGHDLTSMRTVYLGGALVPPELARGWEAALGKAKVSQLFGMTESLMTIFVPCDAPAERRHSTIGLPTPGLAARVADDADAPLPADTEGQLQIRGFSIFPGYVGNDAANADAFTADGWFRTGDLAVIDADGYVRITGRVKDVINRGGIKINPSEIEYALVEHAAVVQAAIVPMPDPVYGERACLFVTLQPGATFTFEDMTGHLAAHGVAKLRWPERLEIIDEMPATPTRKVMKRELVKRLVAGG